jgi:hypothetical protein
MLDPMGTRNRQMIDHVRKFFFDRLALRQPAKGFARRHRACEKEARSVMTAQAPLRFLAITMMALINRSLS